MSAITLPARSGRRPAWTRMATWQAIGHWYVFAGFLALALIVVAVVLALVARAGHTPTLSGMQFAQQVGMWMPFAVAIHYVTSWLGPHVAAGMTRRSFVRAAVTAVLALAASAALVLWSLLRLEQWIYGRLGWTAGYDPGRATPEAAPVPYVWGLFVLLAAAGLTGLIVGASYFRLGSTATLLLPLTLSPLVVIALLALDPSRMFAPAFIRIDGEVRTPPDLGLGGVPASLVFGIGLLALTALILHVLLRRVPIPAPRS